MNGRFRANSVIFASKRHLSLCGMRERSFALQCGLSEGEWHVGTGAELLLRRPWFPAETDIDQLSQVFRVLGTPTPEAWPGAADLPQFLQFAPAPPVPLDKVFPKARPLALPNLPCSPSQYPGPLCTHHGGHNNGTAQSTLG